MWRCFRNIFGISLVCVLALILAVSACQAQSTTTATIGGTVTDTTGAVVPGAVIKILNENTRTTTSTKSNADGRFVVPGLSIGIYTVSATKQGFKTYSETGIQLHPGMVTTVRPHLQVGSVVSQVTVKATAVQVQTSTPEISSEVSGEQAYTLPLDGRNYQSLAALMPGVTNVTPDTALNQGG